MNLFIHKDILIPAIIQDQNSKQVLMLGYMNKEAYELTLETKWVHFFSRSKQRIWKKGESSGNLLALHTMYWDCDQDALLVWANPLGPTCHRNTNSCFDDQHSPPQGHLYFLRTLEQIIQNRMALPTDSQSYIALLTSKGASKIAQKIGEEGVEVALEMVQGNKNKIIEESADLLFHLMVGLSYHQISIEDVMNTLIERNKMKKGG